MPSRARRRVLAALLALTVVALAADLAGLPGASVVRSAGAAVLGPLERAVAGADHRLAEVSAERDRYAVLARTAAADRETASRLEALVRSPGARDARLVPARVVAVGAQGAAGPERVTIDVGSRDGIEPDLSVITAEGLVGRTLTVGPWTSDVLVVGAADLVVAVRAGRPGTLGAVSAAAGTAPRPRPAGQLSLALVQNGSAVVGDPVSTLGSDGGRPFPAGIPVGTVVSLDPSRGSLTRTAAVQPAVDPTTLDVVGVLMAGARNQPRPATTGAAR